VIAAGGNGRAAGGGRRDGPAITARPAAAAVPGSDGTGAHGASGERLNPATALARVLVDELVRCGVSEAVVAPGSRSAPLALALYEASQGSGGRLRLHVRIDERAAAFLALGLGKASGRPAAVVCTSGTAAAHFHAAVIEAGEADVPLLVITADRPPELRGTGASQTVDQLHLYGGAVRWFAEVGVPEARAGMTGYWRSLACRAWAAATGAAGGAPGAVHLNVALRDPLVPGLADPAAPAAGGQWPESLAGRAGGGPWTRFGDTAGRDTPPGRAGAGGVLTLPWTERGVIVAGDGTADPEALVELAEAAGWPLLAEPSSGARQGSAALSGYPYLLGAREFIAAHRPDVIVSAGRPGLSRGQLGLLRGTIAGGTAPPARHVVLEQAPGRWSDPARSATDVAGRVRLTGARPAGSGWLASWRRADAAAVSAAAELLGERQPPGERQLPGGGDMPVSEPALARDVAALLPGGALLWAASSMPARDLDRQMIARGGLRVLASRGASGIDGLVSSAIGAALAHQAAGGGPAVALLGDLALLHDTPGLVLGPDEPRPDLCLLVVNNDGGGIFSTLEQAALPGPFERVFGTPHGTRIEHLAAAFGLPYQRLAAPAALPQALAGRGLRIVEARTDRAASTALRVALDDRCAKAAIAAG
jgi:2-succinyl-5-enolpyruvyl-6-hydroxy-3-cyclohexene-1-carboxylate synthase